MPQRRTKIVEEVSQVSRDARESGALTNLDEVRAARRVEVLSLKLAGFTLAQIAERVDMSERTVSRLITTSLESAENLAVDQMREVEGQRLDRAQAALWSNVLKGDTKATDTFLRISQRRARLYGLDAPTQIALSINVREEMESALDELHRVVMGEVISVHDETDEREQQPALPATSDVVGEPDSADEPGGAG